MTKHISNISKQNLWEEPVVEQKYLILAGKNKFERQLFLGGYRDCSDWFISVVPTCMTLDKCNKIIRKATKELEPLKVKFPRKYPKDMTFVTIKCEEYKK